MIVIIQGLRPAKTKRVAGKRGKITGTPAARTDRTGDAMEIKL